MTTRPKLDSPAIVGRIRHLIHLMRLRQGAFAARISLDPGNFSKVLSGTLPVTSGLINRIVADLGVSKPWLTDGQGVPFERPSEATDLPMPTPAAHLAGPCAGIPVFDIDVMAGTGELSRLFTADRVIGHVDMPNLHADSAIVRVNGDSMSPVIKDGGYVAIRPVGELRYIFWGQIYVIVMDDYRLVKYLRRHPSDPGLVVLRSANHDYDDMEVERSDIRRLFLVEAIINYDIRS
ncbi:MAG: helix-turn-helix transcriptional regulator [Muribaculaceae bacterium]|nr:helix-turn-helix transcriptional regulator [Muribaculaceae bacterium]